MTPHDQLMRHLERRHRAWRRFLTRTRRLAEIADPRTGGNETLCHNWGDAEARAVWLAGWKRWHAYAGRSEAITRDLMQRHVRAGRPQ